jgi:hypothetical protein
MNLLRWGSVLWTGLSGAKTILHFSDVHLNISLEEMHYAFDTSPRYYLP